MLNRRALVATVFVVLASGAAAGRVTAQVTPQDVPQVPKDLPSRNPFEGNPDAILGGQGLYRGRCANCHGIDARGVRGPDLTLLRAAGATDQRLFTTVRRGVPGTEMPASSLRTLDSDIWKILAYLSTISVPAASDGPRGNAENGARIFRAQCASCHLVNGEGGRLGPDLSRVGASRGRSTMVRQIRGANEDFRPGYEPVTLVMSGGQTVRGVKKNEDLFSVQIMDTRERIQGYIKEALRTVTNEQRSAMPTYTVEMLSERDLDDVVRYLETLRAPAPL